MTNRLGLICFLLGLVLVWGCAGKKTEKNPAPVVQPTSLERLQEKAVFITPVPARDAHEDDAVLEDEIQVADPMQPEGPRTALPVETQRELPAMPVTMKMHDISLPVLLRTLARVADLDIMLTDNIKGTTKISITDVPWNQAFQGVLDTFGLSYEWSGDILRVVGVEDLKKKQALMEARQNYEKTRNTHKLTLMAQEQTKAKLEPLVTKIVKINYADLASLQANLIRYLSRKDEAPAGQDYSTTAPENTDTGQASSDNIMVDEHSNSLIIHATRSQIKKVMPIIRRLDQPTHQVLIEAHIVEAEANTGKELGVQWGGLGTVDSGNGKSLSLGGNMQEFNNSLEEGHTPTDGNIVNLPLSAAASGTGMTLGLMAQKVGDYVLYTQLLALEEEGKLNILSKPSITTLDHRKAVIKSGREVPYQTVVNDDINIEWKEAVIKLEVTPHIVNDRIVRLEIITHKDELDFENNVEGNPTVITKNAETNVMLFDGQTTVIGGLNKEKTSGTESGVPGLRNTPGLGWLFKSIDDSSEMEELLIFITPRILKGATELSDSQGS